MPIINNIEGNIIDDSQLTSYLEINFKNKRLKDKTRKEIYTYDNDTVSFDIKRNIGVGINLEDIHVNNRVLIGELYHEINADAIEIVLPSELDSNFYYDKENNKNISKFDRINNSKDIHSINIITDKGNNIYFVLRDKNSSNKGNMYQHSHIDEKGNLIIVIAKNSHKYVKYFLDEEKRIKGNNKNLN